MVANMLLVLRTDKPEAEVGLYSGETRIAYKVWHAHRELSVTLLSVISELLTTHNEDMKSLEGIVAFVGPGSFTGLRIGISVANALAYGLGIPITGAGGDDWIVQGIKKLQQGVHEQVVLPVYGAAPHITLPRTAATGS